jgi:hypothetical protein
VPVEGGATQQVGVPADSADGTDARVLGDAKQIKSPAVHPDGSWIAFAMAELDDSEILTLENFLPVARASN